MAKMFGYKVKPIVPSYVDLTFTSNVNADSGDVSKVDYSNAGVFDDGYQVNLHLKFRYYFYNIRTN